MEKIFKKNPDIISKSLRDEIVLLNPVTGKYYGLNRVGCAFWEKIDGVRNLEQIVSLMLEEFNVDKTTLADDLEALTKKLLENNLIEVEG